MVTKNLNKKRTIYLSRKERRIGGKLFLRLSALNGLGTSFLSDSTIALLAMHFGAGNVEMGIISAMMYISGIVLLAVPRVFHDKNVVAVGFWAWITRGIVSVPYFLLFFLDGEKAVYLIIFLYALFCIARTTGVAMITTIQKKLMLSRTQSEILFRNATSFQGSQIISRFISYLILSLKNIAELTALLTLPALGLIFNTFAAFTLKKVPNRTTVDYKKGENIFIIFRRTMKNANSRRIMFLRWISLGHMILMSMTIPFLSRSAGLDSGSIFLFTLSLSTAAFISSILLRPVAVKAGSRPLMFFAVIPSIVLFAVWGFISENLSVEAYLILGFFSMFSLNAAMLGANRLLVSITPDTGAVGFNSMETFVTSIMALTLGFSAGLLADFSHKAAHTLPVNNFGFVFLLSSAAAVYALFLILKVKEPGSMSLKEAAKILTNIGNLKTWQTVSQLEITADPVKRKTLIHSVGHSRAPIAAGEIKKILSEPLSHEKGDLISALFFTKRPELEEFLHEEVLEPNSFHREKAVFALGSYPSEKTKEILIKLLDDKDPIIRSGAAKSLGRIGCTSVLEKVKELWKNSTYLHERLDYMIALYHMDKEKEYLSDIFSEWIIKSGEKAQRTYYTLAAQQFGMSPPFGVIYREEAVKYGSGLDILLEEARDTEFMLEEAVEITELWHKKEYREIWKKVFNELENTSPPGELYPVKKALNNFNIDLAGHANTLASLYFTYQILTSEVEE